MKFSIKTFVVFLSLQISFIYLWFSEIWVTAISETVIFVIYLLPLTTFGVAVFGPDRRYVPVPIIVIAIICLIAIYSVLLTYIFTFIRGLLRKKSQIQ